MGRINSDQPKKETTTNHFSHEHPLNLTNHQPQQTVLNTSTCAGCKLKPSGLIYSCTTCAYFLHKNCFEMPKKITHPCHKEHPFSLLPKPAYPDGLFNCDACNETGRGFSYHCKPCGIDLHILCAVMPLCVTHAFHAHKLDLTYESPYGTIDFCCDICKNNGSNHWLYRCGSCGFDAHLNCARGVTQPPVQQQSPINFMGFQPSGSLPQHAATTSRSTPQPQAQGYPPQFTAANTFSPRPMMGNGVATGFPSASPCMPQYGMNTNEMAVNQAILQMINNNNALTQAIIQATQAGGVGNNNNMALTQAILQASQAGGVGNNNNNALTLAILQASQAGGVVNNNNIALMQAILQASQAGGVGNNMEQQQLMQLMAGLNNGGIGGGGIPGMVPFGGGVGQEYLQALMNGGGGIGGGGTDLTSLLGGGNVLDLLGGAGGADLISGLLGGFTL